MIIGTNNVPVCLFVGFLGSNMRLASFKSKRSKVNFLFED
jgi:hypothetical protein